VTNYLLIAILCSSAYLVVFVLFAWGLITVLEIIAGDTRQ